MKVKIIKIINKEVINRMNKNFELESTTVWSFPTRGTWATHNSKYAGNFAPELARNIILRFSSEDDTILDPMVGGGTTLIEGKLLNRKSIGFDINPNAIKIAKENLNFNGNFKYEPELEIADVRNLSRIKNNSIDLILTHPPYLDIIKYSKGKIDKDLSNISDVESFCNEFEKDIEVTIKRRYEKKRTT